MSRATRRCLVRDPLLAGFRSTMAVDYKTDLHDVVTRHDKESEAAIRRSSCRSPGFGVVGEEDGASGKACRAGTSTRSTEHRTLRAASPSGASRSARPIDDEIVAGAILDPVGGNLFSADLAGAWLNGDPLRSRAVAERAARR